MAEYVEDIPAGEFAEQVYIQMGAEGKTVSQVLDELDITDQRLRNRVVAGAPRGAPQISEMPRTTEYSVGEMGYGESRAATPLGETTTPVERGQTRTGKPIGIQPAIVGEVGLSPVAEGPVMGGAGLKMPYVPGAGKVREAMGGVTEKVGERRELRGARKESLLEQERERRAFLGEAKEYELEKGRAEAEVYQEQQKTHERLAREQIKSEGRRQDYVKAEMGKIQGLIGELQSAKIDPTRFYRHPDGSTNFPKSVAAAIAVGLGALGSSLPAQYGGTGGPNVALQIIDKAIDRDISAQRDDIANKRAGVGLQMNALTQVQQMYSGERKQEAALRALMYETTKIQLQNIAYANPDPRVQLKYKELEMGLTAKTQDAFDTLAMESSAEELGAAEKQVGWEATATQLGQRAAGMRQAQAAQQAKTAPGVAAPGVKHPTLDVVDPAYNQSLDPATRKKNLEQAQKVASLHGEAMTEIDKLIAWRERYGIETLDRKAISDGKKLMNRAKSVMRAVDRTGARLEVSELEMMGLEFDIDAVGGFAGALYAVGLGEDPVLSGLRIIKSSVNNKIQNHIKTYNYSLRSLGSGKPVSGGGATE